MNRREFFAFATIGAHSTVAPSIVEFPFEYVHLDHVAFLLREEPQPGGALHSSDMAWPDGSPVPYGGIITCGGCGVTLNPTRSQVRRRK